MSRRRAGFAWILSPAGLGLVALLFGVATAMPRAAADGLVVGGVIDTAGVLVDGEVSDAFARGARELGGQDDTPPKLAESRVAALAAADEARGQGETAFLAINLRQAEKHLAEAVAVYLDDPATLADASGAAKAALLLAQVQLLRRQRGAADETLDRAVATLPGFPGDQSPPPDVEARLSAAREWLGARAGARLTVTSRPPGAPVRVNGMAMGRTPVVVPDLVPGTYSVRVAGHDGSVWARQVAVTAPETTVDFVFGDPTAAEALRAAVAAGQSGRAWRAAKQLEQSAQARRTCLAVIDADQVLVVRLSGATRTIIGARRVPRPTDGPGWRSVGRQCAEGPPDTVGPAEVERTLWPAAETSEPEELGADEGGMDRRTWGWAGVGAGVAAFGVGTFMGMRALSAADDYNRTGAASDEDRARSSAIGADVSFVSGAALVGLGVYLLLTADPPTDVEGTAFDGTASGGGPFGGPFRW